MSEKSIILTIEVLPLKKGKREIIVSGAPAGEMPVVHAGVFADVHTLINTTWAELLRRDPQPVTYPKATNEKDTAKPTAEEGTQAPAVPTETEIKAESIAPVAHDEAGDQLVASEGATDNVPAPMLSTLDDETQEDQESSENEESEVSDD